jgi:hypothetical protein
MPVKHVAGGHGKGDDNDRSGLILAVPVTLSGLRHKMAAYALGRCGLGP